MKTYQEKQDGVMENLLRAYRPQSESPRQVCEEFDPDLANAYIERKLKESELSRYEHHLSACSPCRRSVTALARMSESDAAELAVLPQPIAARTSTGLVVRIKQTFGSLSAPRWAVAAAAAAIILAVAIPLFLARKDAQPAQFSSSPENLQARASNSATGGTLDQQRESVAANSNTSAPMVAPEAAATTIPGRATSTEARDQQATGAGLPAGEPASVASGETTNRADMTAEKAESQTQPAATGEAAPKAANETAVASRTAASDSRANQVELGKIDPEEARRLGKEKDSAQMNVLRPGVPDGTQRERTETAIRPEDSVPEPPPSPSTRPRGRMTEESTRSIRQGRLSDSVRSPALAERKVGGRKFWLREDVWTDKDYNPNKDMPAVTVIRDSENYKELIAKHSSLRTFFRGFDSSARVIVVYKGIVYKLIPQE